MIEILQNSPPIAIAIALIFGLLVGSFLNVVIYRIPKMLENDWTEQAAEMNGQELPDRPKFNLATPGSACPNCGHKITALENIPVLSWLFLKGKCSDCKTKISMRYPFVELTTGLLCALSIWYFGFTAMGLAGVVLTLFLIALTGIDFDTQLLPDNMTLPLIWIGLILNLNGVFTDLPSAVVGAVAGYLILWSIYWLFKLLTGKEGMGYGDFKLLAALGAWFGWQTLPAIILMSSVIGAVFGIALILFTKRGREVPMAFGPFLAGAGLVTLYFHPVFLDIFGAR